MENLDLAIARINQVISTLDLQEKEASIEEMPIYSKIKTELYQCLIDIRQGRLAPEPTPPAPPVKPAKQPLMDSDLWFPVLAMLFFFVVFYILFYFKIIIPVKS